MSFLGILGSPPAMPTPGAMGPFRTPPIAPTHDEQEDGPPAMLGNIGTGFSFPQANTQTQQTAPQAPTAQKPPSIWDKEHWNDTLLGIASGLLGSNSLGAGLAGAATSIRKSNQDLKASMVKENTLGGPDNVFEVTTDPRTGKKTYTLNDKMAEYKRQQGFKTKDANERRDRALAGISRLPQEQQAAAYANFMAHPEAYDVDSTAGLPAAYDPSYVSMRGGMGQSVYQTSQGERADARQADHNDQFGQRMTFDREKFGVQSAQAAERISQGAQRVQLAREGAAKKPPKGYVSVSSPDQYNSLPSGAHYVAPDGSRRIKK